MFYDVTVYVGKAGGLYEGNTQYEFVDWDGHKTAIVTKKPQSDLIEELKTRFKEVVCITT